jgi:MtrB/PioB family decaheme-associated outer membrane protein
MTRMFSLRAALFASVCLLPLQVLAQTQGSSANATGTPVTTSDQPAGNWITIGGQYNSNGSDYLNRFNGNTHPGFYGLGDFHVGQHDAWDSGGTFYWDAEGNDLGFDDRRFDARIGQQGVWGLTFSYDGIPYEGQVNVPSVWQRSGATVPGVAPGSIPLVYPKTPFVRGVGSVNSLWLPVPDAALAGQLYGYNIGTQRDIFAGTGRWQWGNWLITGAIRHDHKTGYQLNSLEIGGTVGLTTAGTGGSKNTAPTGGVTSGLGYFAMPIDYDMDRYDLTAAYNAPRYQVQIGYTFSHFTDNLSEFNAVNPFGLNPTTTFGTAAANLSVPYALPPSNSAHQIRAMLGYNITPTTRFNANFEYGLEMQDSSFISGSGDPVTHETEPGTSFNGLIQTLFGNVALTSQPLPNLDVRVSYTIDDRDNQSPRNLYQVNTRSNTSTSANGDCALSAGLCGNLPYSYEHQTLSLEAGYRILPQTKVTLNDTVESTYRNYADMSFVTSNTATIKVRSRLNDDLFGSLSYSHQDRNANNQINGNTWALLSGTGVGADPAGLVMYFEASRKHDELKSTLDWSPTNTVSGTMMLKFANDRYPDTTYGLRNNHNIEIGPDVSWQVTPAINAHAYYTYQQIYYDQSSIYNSGTNFGAGGTGYHVPWTAKTTDSVHTFGLSVDWEAIKDVLKISLDYNLSYGDTAYALGDGMALIGGSITSPSTIAALNFQPLPDVTSMLNMIQITGQYKVRPNMTVIFGYAFEKFDYNDFMNIAAPTQYANAVLPGTLSPNAVVQVVGAGMRIRF